MPIDKIDSLFDRLSSPVKNINPVSSLTDNDSQITPQKSNPSAVSMSSHTVRDTTTSTGHVAAIPTPVKSKLQKLGVEVEVCLSSSDTGCVINPDSEKYDIQIHRMSLLLSTLISHHYISIQSAVSLISKLVAVSVPSGMSVRINRSNVLLFPTLLENDSLFRTFTISITQLLQPVLVSFGSVFLTELIEADIIKNYAQSLSQTFLKHIALYNEANLSKFSVLGGSDGTKADNSNGMVGREEMLFIRLHNDDIDDRNEYKSQVFHYH